jgi:hypothetical protein
MFNGYRDFLSQAKVGGGWSWPLPPHNAEVKNAWNYYLHSAICFHGVMLNKEQGQLHIYLQATSNYNFTRHNWNKRGCWGSRREVQFLCFLSDSWVISRFCKPTGYNILWKPFFSKSGESRIHRGHLYAVKVRIRSKKYYTRNVLNLRCLTYFGNLLS